MSNHSYKKECLICGANSANEKIIYMHLTPKQFRNPNDRKDLVTVCINCDRALDFGLREISFMNFLHELILSSKKYDQIKLEHKVGNIDKLIVDMYLTQDERISVVECKSVMTLSKTQNNEIINFFDKVNTKINLDERILAIPTRIPIEAKVEYQKQRIDVWDIDYIADVFSRELQQMPDSVIKSYFLIFSKANVSSFERRFITDLEQCKPGKEDWSKYQRLIGKILEEYFCPPLSKPICESRDSTNSNRRDYILPNYSNEGFWKFIRDKYNADYVVVDAKNYSRKVSKKDILQIANYLKPFGAGSFGIIFSRKGGDNNGCFHTVREQWMLHSKMIIILDDYDMKSILTSPNKKGVEEVISAKIQDFRLKM
ncbi:HNH endonuclease signature motif containing protein [Paenibacillus lautus]|uniref:HNH endonuclease signature motif containing protein n=1 Tax=Paenibacillus lautus TaxID=1401 RepID=UPI003D2A2604